MYRGELLPGFYDEWVLRERERLEAVFERKMSDLLDRLVAERRWPEVLETAERWIAVGHVPEPAYRALMLAHSERGDRARVATVYQRCRQALFEELGATPSEQTRRLFDDLSRGLRVLPPLAEADEPAAQAHASSESAPRPVSHRITAWRSSMRLTPSASSAGKRSLAASSSGSRASRSSG